MVSYGVVAVANTTRRVGELFLFERKGWLVKFRATYSEENADADKGKAEELVQAFLKANGS